MNNLCICIIINKEVILDQNKVTQLNDLINKTQKCILYDCISSSDPLIQQINFTTTYHDIWTSDEQNISKIFDFDDVKNMDYLWIHDINDNIIGTINLPILTDDCYLLRFATDIEYWKRCIFKLSKTWRLTNKYYGTLVCSNNDDNIKTTKLQSDYYIKYAYPNYDIDNLLNDVSLMDDIDDFYMAEHLYSLSNLDHAFNYYKIASIKTTNLEKKYISYIKMGDINKINNTNSMNFYMKAYNILQYRGEAILRISMLSRQNGDYETAYKYSKLGTNLVVPQNYEIGIDIDAYRYKLLDELSISAYYMGNYEESHDAYKKLVAMDINNIDKQRIINNMAFTVNKIKELNKNNNIAIYIGSYQLTQKNYNSISNILKQLSGYNIYITSEINQNYTINNAIFINNNILNKLYNQNFFISVIHINNCNLFVLENGYTIANNTTNILYLCDKTINVYLTNGIYLSLNTNIHKTISNKYDTIIIETPELYSHYETKYELHNYKLLDDFMNNTNNLISKKVIDKMDNKIDNIIDEYRLYDAIKFNYPIQMKNVNFDNEHHNQSIIETLNNIKNMLIQEYKIYCTNEMLHFYKKINDINNHTNLCKYIIESNNITINNTHRIEEQIKLHLLNADLYKKMGDIVNPASNNLQAFNEYSNILKYHILKEDEERTLYTIRDILIDTFKDIFLEYPQEKISRIRNTEGNILFSITTCKRFDLFEKTMNSFINCCNDINLINKWICVDDNSSIRRQDENGKIIPFF